MKSNFLKTSLSAFAFALAIMASFAFSPAFNNAEDLIPIDGYVQTTGETPCISKETCSTNSANPVCKNASDIQLYGITTSLGSTTCFVTVYEP